MIALLAHTQSNLPPTASLRIDTYYVTTCCLSRAFVVLSAAFSHSTLHVMILTPESCTDNSCRLRACVGPRIFSSARPRALSSVRSPRDRLMSCLRLSMSRGSHNRGTPLVEWSFDAACPCRSSSRSASSAISSPQPPSPQCIQNALSATRPTHPWICPQCPP